MLQFFKKSGRKSNGKPTGSSDNTLNRQESGCGDNAANVTLLEIEKLCQDQTHLFTDYHQSFSKNLQQILSDKNYLSYFIQFLDSKKALPLIKFWLDAESFKIAAEQCNQINVNQLVKSQFKAEKYDWLETNHENCKKLNIHKSKSVDTCSDQLSDSFDCESMLSKSIFEKQLCDINAREQDVEDRNEFDSVSDIHKLCDMDKPLTDDEKSQLCEQNILKQQHLISKLKSHKESHKDQPEPEIKLIENHSNKKHRNFESTLATYAIRIFNKYLTSKSSSFIDIPATIVSAISLAFCSNDSTNTDNQSVATIFVEAQLYVLERLETIYLSPFIESSFYCKYCVDILTGEHLKVQDILYCESLLFYFMEFLEQENARQYLDFWVAATNFKKLFNDGSEASTNQQTRNDALILYEKYFSLQATSSLKLSDNIRYQVEERICAESGPITNCFDFPLHIIERYLEKKYFNSFITSNLFYKYLSELLKKSDGKPSRQNSLKISSKNVSRHKKSYSDCSSEQCRNSLQISGITPRSSNNKLRPSSATDMQIESKQMYNPDLLWSRNSSITGLQFGRVNALGRYERDFELDPAGDRSHTTKSSKIKQAVKKWVNLPEEKVQEEIAWQVAEMIVKDITNITLNCTQINRTET